MEQISKETLLEINKEIEVVLKKYGVTLQPTMGISIVPLPKPEEIISPIQADDISKKD